MMGAKDENLGNHPENLQRKMSTLLESARVEIEDIKMRY